MRKPENQYVSKVRAVTYAFTDGGRDLHFDCEYVLSRASATGTVLQYDDGRGHEPWFTARPGAAARALRDRFLAAGYEIKKT